MKFLKRIALRLKRKKEIYLIDLDQDRDFIQHLLEDEKILAIDTEFDWRRTYYPTLSLLQIATENSILLIDCIGMKNLSFLKKILENKETLVIFHSARSDTTVLFTALGIKITNVFDIQIAEKFISKSDIKNYASIVETYFPIKLLKTETNSNWLKRPFSEDQLQYAADDVEYLIGIYKKQKKILIKKNDLNLILDASRKEANAGNDDLHVSRLKKLKKAGQKEKKIFLWREKIASEKNIPPSHIFKDKQMNLLKNIKSENDIDNLLIILKDKILVERFLSEIIG
ncbi:ribonuclease D [SAR86 cluster bacterium]|nr:ribonuclease D [SAR86 cluster bacterium]